MEKIAVTEVAPFPSVTICGIIFNTIRNIWWEVAVKSLIRDTVFVIALITAIMMTVKADWEFNTQPDDYPYKFETSMLVPKWGMNVGACVLKSAGLCGDGC